MSLDKEYRPEAVERRLSEEWADPERFKARPASGDDPFCMVIPPPNVTGDLHIGHVLVYTLHDVVARWRRMQGRDVLWLPGTDHAGIATQMVVERMLAEEGTDRHRLGREAFEKRAWEWKDRYGGRILDALRRLGSTVDWSRERFTLDDGLSRAVRTVFVRLYREGLIYRDRYIVNWCPRCRTAISDLETVHEPVHGSLWTIRYPAADGGEPVVLATTRPETMLGDTGVAVHPDDPRYRDRVGGRLRVPLTGREVPIVADTFVDPEFGTGAVKLTPAHDPNDFEAARRLDLPQLVVIGPDATMTELAGSYAGLDRLEARRRVLEDLEAEGLLVGTTPHEHAVGHCQRCSTMIEPLVSTQWFVKVEPLAKEAIAAVEDGRTRFVPDTWSKVYFEWMRNIHDWCISRQLWWGHRIPAWYCDDCDQVVVDEVDPERCPTCSAELRQDEDVLDTWFSSALWPFSTLGWPESTDDLARYYPTSLLITGHDIIFFWVARMMMMGLKFMGDVPFREVYIHGLVRDSAGKKMSKSKGNTVDPKEVQERYGTDAVRFTMAILAAPGNDIPLAHERMEGYRAFANKLWNAQRFVLMRLGDDPVGPVDEAACGLAERWIRSRCQATLEEVERSMEAYRFDRAADALYHFAWGQYCDWYIELAKPALFVDAGADDAARAHAATTRAVLCEVADTLLRMLHPFMPFITEELWPTLPGNDGSLAAARWPASVPARRDQQAERTMELLQAIAVKVRNLRAESNIPPGRPVEVLLRSEDPSIAAALDEHASTLAPLVRASAIHRRPSFADGLVAARGAVAGVEIALPLEGVLDLDAERSRIERELEKLERELVGRAKRLDNPSFVERAPAEVVAKVRDEREELAERVGRLRAHLDTLGPGS